MSNVEGMPAGQPPTPSPEKMEWFDSEQPKPITEVSAQEFERLCEALYEVDALKDQLSDELKAVNGRIEKIEKQVLAYFHEWKRTDYKSKKGLLFVAKKRSWKLPQGDERQAFFDHLKKEGTFEGMITVNSNTFNSYLKEKFEKAESEGNSAAFSVPGVGEPSVFESLRRKGN